MKALSLEDLQPLGAEFTLKATDKTYRLRPFNLRDEEWLRKTYGDRLQKVMNDMEMLEIARIAFHQMEEEDKKEFAKKDVSLMNEEGDTIDARVGGYELLFWLISGWSEKIEIYKALLQTIGVSRELVAKFTEEEIAAQATKAKAEAERFAALSREEQESEVEKKKSNWAIVFDRLSNEYGWTSPDIWALTRREVAWRLACIHERTVEHVRFQGVLHDKQFDLPAATPTGNKEPEESEVAVDDEVIKRHLAMRQAEKLSQATGD